jgi:hypothetical protein
MALQASVHGPEFDAAAKVLREKGKPQGIMRTWWCRMCSGRYGQDAFKLDGKVTGTNKFYVDIGKPGCEYCTEMARQCAVAAAEAELERMTS